MTVTALQDSLQTWRSQYPRFDPAGLTGWLVEGTLAGWVSPAMASRLRESGLFEESDDGLTLSRALGGPLGRSHALQCLAEVLRGEGWIQGWRDEAYDWVDDWGRVRFSLERAAFRPLGLCSRAVHVNGYIEDGGIWIARRALHKAVDPGRLDNMTAGGIAAGETVRDCLLRELAEEAGIPTRLALLARPAGVLRSQRREPDGIHDEMLYCFDLALPPDFVPINTDGEVDGFELLDADEAAARLGEMTLDAALVTAAWLDRWMDGEV
ncbi:NUDIX hydrolase family protein [Chitinimonas sp. BJYL2]|uniref:NUDIX hydrolase n=1 Tax=Chitinimonas sp. BJYL2 TaxID=2976696 RepID=UPI0022B4B511|nr:DUF4743 domain-containing protein [Chitinimonas sp. BJYL2]